MNCSCHSRAVRFPMPEFDQDSAEVTGIDDATEFVLMNVEPGGAVEAECEFRISCSSRAYLVRGPVHVAGDLQFDRDKFDRATVIIAGGLTVDGVLEDCGGDACTIVVMGDLVATHLLWRTSWLVRGTTKVASTVVSGAANDAQFVCDGNVTCDVLIQSGSRFDATTRVSIEEDQLEAACLQKDGTLDFVEIARRLKANEPIVRTS